MARNLNKICRDAVNLTELGSLAKQVLRAEPERSSTMTLNRLKNEKPKRSQLRADMVSALANGAAGILQHVKWPMLIEMELAQSALAQEDSRHLYPPRHQQN